MHTEKTRDKGDEAKSGDFGFAPMGQQMFEMMTKCCAGRGSFPDCLTMTGEMKKQHRAPRKGAVESGGTRK